MSNSWETYLKYLKIIIKNVLVSQNDKNYFLGEIFSAKSKLKNILVKLLNLTIVFV